ncbi:hypothetical protein JTE90_011572 [Oedothorax gibbosus]|uniref:Uncharacterized protein n=1 Tax=Oedothorax gibbosus TaxID=931172 RepID=A0AAV6UNF0_9ARAC|nr:hypothetical protein JTE90_011572 [Oedothorax gibbosus]
MKSTAFFSSSTTQKKEEASLHEKEIELGPSTPYCRAPLSSSLDTEDLTAKFEVTFQNLGYLERERDSGSRTTLIFTILGLTILG